MYEALVLNPDVCGERLAPNCWSHGMTHELSGNVLKLRGEVSQMVIRLMGLNTQRSVIKNYVAAISPRRPHRRSWTCSDPGCAHLTRTQSALQWKCWSGFFPFHFPLKRAAWDTSCGSMNSCICGRCVTMHQPGKVT